MSATRQGRGNGRRGGVPHLTPAWSQRQATTPGVLSSDGGPRPPCREQGVEPGEQPQCPEDERGDAEASRRAIRTRERRCVGGCRGLAICLAGFGPASRPATSAITPPLAVMLMRGLGWSALMDGSIQWTRSAPPYSRVRTSRGFQSTSHRCPSGSRK